MTPTEALKIIKRLKQEGTIGDDKAIEVLLDSQSSLITKVEGIETRMEKKLDEILDYVQKTNSTVEGLVKHQESVQKNPAFRVGAFYSQHTKLSWFLIVNAFVAFNFWFIDSVRFAILEAMKVPESVIQFFVRIP